MKQINETVKLVEEMIKALVDEPDEADVLMIAGKSSVILEIHVAPDDVRRIIGRRGRTADAVRLLVDNIGAKQGVRYIYEIAEPGAARVTAPLRSVNG